MYSSTGYILAEFLIVLLAIAGLKKFAILLKLRHLVMLLFLIYIVFIASKIQLELIQNYLVLPDIMILIFYCLLPTIVVSKVMIELHAKSPRLLVDTTKIINPPGFPKIAPLVLYPLLSVPLQEILFRWFYIGRLESASLSTAAVVILSSLVFGVVHLPFGSKPLFVGTFVAGIWWGILYITTGNLWYPIISHAILGNILIWLTLYKSKSVPVKI